MYAHVGAILPASPLDATDNVGQRPQVPPDRAQTPTGNHIQPFLPPIMNRPRGPEGRPDLAL
jgi:hypothetical protein